MSITAVVGGLASVVSSFFGFKGRQAGAITTGIKALNDINSSEGEREAAIASIITSEANSGYWLAAVWRPLLMVFFAALIGARWFGYIPPNMSETELLEVYGLLKLGIGGYIGGRSLEKMITSMKLGSTLKAFVEKKIG